MRCCQDITTSENNLIRIRRRVFFASKLVVRELGGSVIYLFFSRRERGMGVLVIVGVC